MKKLSFVATVLLFFTFACSGGQKKPAPAVSLEYQGQDAVTLRLKPELSITMFDGYEVLWPPVGKDSVQIAPGVHSLECSYHVTLSTDDATTQKSANGLLFKSENLEANKNYLLDYKLSSTNIELFVTAEDKPTDKAEEKKE